MDWGAEGAGLPASGLTERSEPCACPCRFSEDATSTRSRASAAAFDDLLSDFGRRLPVSWSPAADFNGLAALDIAETKDAVEITAELPGVDEADVKVSVDGQSVVISGEKKSESERKDKAWQVVERSYGAFRRVVPLTFTPDAAKITGDFRQGGASRDGRQTAGNGRQQGRDSHREDPDPLTRATAS